MAGAVGFSLALSISSVALPLLALSAGYSSIEVGVLTALSAVAQLGIRLVIGALMRRYPDWLLVLLAALLLATSTAIVSVSAALVPFVLCELAQGAARGAFWTGSQTHVVRGSASAVSGMAKVNLASAVGLLVGPVAAGLLAEQSLRTALVLATVVAGLTCVPTLFLDKLPPFRRVKDRPPGLLWTRPGVDVGCAAGATAGAWRGLLGSYVPVALDAARQSSSVIGALVSVANAASLIGAASVARLARGSRRLFVTATLGCGFSTALVAWSAGSAVVAGLLLAISGLAAGALQTVGPALATDSVHPEERGDAIAASGTFRAGALFASPLLMAGLLGTVALGPAMALVGLAIAAPSLMARRLPVAHPDAP
ncbi:MAG TPA: MFS transporter [Actinomycetales bacterium]|nr:MFS transporter [Actinomycetales bacterium]